MFLDTIFLGFLEYYPSPNPNRAISLWLASLRRLQLRRFPPEVGMSEVAAVSRKRQDEDADRRLSPAAPGQAQGYRPLLRLRHSKVALYRRRRRLNFKMYKHNRK